MSFTGKTHINLLIICLCIITPSVISAQESEHVQKVRTLIDLGDSLRTSYRFKESLKIYDSALQLTENELYMAADSLLRLDVQDKILMSENGCSMTGFVDSPKVIARRRFSIEDFFLYYPLQDSCWRSVPNQLDSMSDHSLAKATFIRNQDETVFWSAADNEGIRNIYTSSLRDSLWSLPTLLNEQMTSASDDIYPMLSPDGKSLFFSSAGLYGVGGYDIYVSRWNEDTQDWNAPVNMGFPYSSPYDDFLYIDTEDGHHSVFASNRDCAGDSVWVYVLEYDNVPVRRSVEDPNELLDIARLLPASYSSGFSAPSSDPGGIPDLQRYMSDMKRVMHLQDSVSYYSALAAEGREAESLPMFKSLLSQAMKDLHKLEMELLMKGIVVDPDDLFKDESETSVPQVKEFSFVKNNPGLPLDMRFEVPEVKFDYSFKVLEEAQFAEDQTIPSGVVFQIQIFASKKKATMKSLKGLSPVYESSGANAHIVYRVGLFRTYSDVLSNLNTVKKLGFRNAYIVAFLDGKPVTVAKARSKEKEKPAVQEFFEVRMIPSGGELDSSIASGIRQQAAGKDIARKVNGDGTVVYTVGPFSDKTKADDLVLFVRAMGVKDVMCNIIRK